MSAQKMTNVGFLSEFLRRHEKLPERPCCWLLGSGASLQSGIPTGGTLALQWLKELHEMEDFGGLPLEQWATETNLGIPGFDLPRVASFYPFIYERRYRDYKDEFLERHYQPYLDLRAGQQQVAAAPADSRVTQTHR